MKGTWSELEAGVKTHAGACFSSETHPLSDRVSHHKISHADIGGYSFMSLSQCFVALTFSAMPFDYVALTEVAGSTE